MTKRMICLMFVFLCLWHPALAQEPKTQDGISKEQADAILKELRQIRQLLEKQQPSDKLQLNIGSNWYVIGRDDAPVTVVEFTDMQCPYCRRFHTETFPLIKKDYVDTGKVRYVSRDLPLSDMHPYAARAAEGARCAGDQGKYWEFRDAMLESPSLNADTIADSAKRLVPNAASFRACLESEKYAKAVLADADEAASLQIRGTPTFVVARSDKNTLDGIRVDGAQSYHAFQQRIDELLKR